LATLQPIFVTISLSWLQLTGFTKAHEIISHGSFLKEWRRPQMFIDILCRSLVFLISGTLFVALTPPAKAQQITFGTGLVCNQLEDVERYVALYQEGDSADAAVDEVNQEAGQSVCDMITVAYIRGEDIKIIRIAGGFGAIAKVAVVGVRTGTQWLSVTPQEQFMIVSVEDREA
jgi:hypothetical protein